MPENPDLLRLIFSHLDHKSPGALQTNKRWHTLDVQAVWKQLCFRAGPLPALEVTSYKGLY